MTREVIRCPHCALNQFFTRSGSCRKCEQPLIIVEPEPEAEPIAAALRSLPEQRTGVGNVERNLPHVFRVLRQALGLSQRELALKLDKPRTYVSKIEQGHTTPVFKTLEQLATALDVTPYVIIALAEAAP